MRTLSCKSAAGTPLSCEAEHINANAGCIPCIVLLLDSPRIGIRGIRELYNVDSELSPRLPLVHQAAEICAETISATESSRAGSETPACYQPMALVR